MQPRTGFALSGGLIQKAYALHPAAGEGMSPGMRHLGGKLEGISIAPPRLTKPDAAFHSMG